MTKKNLIIVHSFPTNSILLKGLIDFLEDFFNVYFIDLPGFNTTISPLEKINLNNYSEYIETQIKQLNLKNYYLSGISFGFLVANNCKITPNCKGIIAMEPFINTNYMSETFLEKTFLKLLLFLITNLKLHYKFYNTKIFKKLLIKKNPEERINIMLETIDAFTFFETAKIILKHNSELKFHNKPYILVINDNDTEIDSKKIINLFENLEKKLLIKTTSEHYPTEISKKYFEKNINSNNIKKILNFLK